MFKAILVPVDLEHEGSWKVALPFARNLAETYKAELHVLTVVQDIRPGVVSQFFPGDYEEKMVRKAADELEAFCERELKGMKVKPHVATGTVYREIMRVADKHMCDLIVMASHRPELTDLLISPNSAHVVRHANASVMIVR